MAQESGVAPSELRRDVSVWGSYMWGYADVGADIYTALGIVALAALGFTPLAFLFAGLVYALVGLGYAELASAYPVAGGGQYYTLRGIGDLAGFIAGAALLLDYTIDISLFMVVSFGYFNFFLPYLTFGHHISDYTITLGPIHLAWLWLVETLAGILVLIWLNVRGIRFSSAFNEILGVVAIIGQSIIVVAGFVLVWQPGLVAQQFALNRPTLGQFAFGSSLAIISFVGLESISQVAQETRRPATIIPRTSIGLILSVLIFAMAFAILAMGMFPAQGFRGHEGDPVALIAGHIPVIGIVAAPATALIGGMIVFISGQLGRGQRLTPDLLHEPVPVAAEVVQQGAQKAPDAGADDRRVQRSRDRSNAVRLLHAREARQQCGDRPAHEPVRLRGDQRVPPGLHLVDGAAVPRSVYATAVQDALQRADPIPRAHR